VPSSRLDGYGWVYERLMVFDNYGCDPRPWLAGGVSWKDPQTLVFTLRDGVKRNDGQPFAADDVTFDVRSLNPTPDTYTHSREIGQYDMLLGVHGGTCNAFRNFADPLDSKASAPIGRTAISNYVRWQDPHTDQLLAALGAATDEAGQKQAAGDLAHLMMDQVPMIPLWYGAKWFQYRTARVTGWPDQSDPYPATGDPATALGEKSTAHGRGPGPAAGRPDHARGPRRQPVRPGWSPGWNVRTAARSPSAGTGPADRRSRIARRPRRPAPDLGHPGQRRVGRVLGQRAGGVEPDPVDAAVEPAPHGRLGAHLGVVVPQVRLVDVEQVQVPLAVPERRPGRPAEHRRPVRRRRPGRTTGAGTRRG
jgi:hypothetical protein